MKRVLGRFVNALLGAVGLRICRARFVHDLEVRSNRAAFLHEKYVELIESTGRALERRTGRRLPASERRTELMTRLRGTQIPEAYDLLDGLHQALPAGGDVCEFGVALGTTSALLASELLDSDRRLWLFDSFEGLSRPEAEDELLDDIFGLGSMEAYAGSMAYPVEEVRRRLAAIDFPEERVRIVAGFVESTLARSDRPDRVCLAFVDLDLYRPILTALEWLDERIAPGGRIVVDDYGFFSSGAATAVDGFLDRRLDRYLRILPDDPEAHYCTLVRRANA